MCAHIHTCRYTYTDRPSGITPKGAGCCSSCPGTGAREASLPCKPCSEEPGACLSHSHANLLSKLESPMAKAWSAHSG